MYSDEQIMKMFDNIIPKDDESQMYFNFYVNIYKWSFQHPTQSDKYNFHHFYCSFLAKNDSDIMGKNRYWTIQKLDEKYVPNDNVCKLRILYHVMAHYYLAMSLRNTIYEVDARNSFFTLIGDYSRPFESYTVEEIEELGRMIEETAEPNKFDRYMTQNEVKEYMKFKNEEYKENYLNEHKEEIEQKKKDDKEKRKGLRLKWNEEHKEEIEERKRKQKEYVKEMRERYKRDKKALK